MQTGERAYSEDLLARYLQPLMHAIVNGVQKKQIEREDMDLRKRNDSKVSQKLNCKITEAGTHKLRRVTGKDHVTVDNRCWLLKRLANPTD